MVLWQQVIIHLRLTIILRGLSAKGDYGEGGDESRVRFTFLGGTGAGWQNHAKRRRVKRTRNAA
jgi:hypothetical protein